MNKIIAIILMSMISIASVASDDFPGRSVYPNVPYIELDDLYNQRENAVIVDARSPYEYETLNIKGSISVPLSLTPKKYAEQISALRDMHPDKKIVFYCNGHKCMKSYKAALRAMSYVRLTNVYAFDAGIFDWSSKYPMEAMLLGNELKDPKKLISKDNFNSHLMDAEKFIKSADETVVILDIRDRIDRDGFYLFARDETSISLTGKDKVLMDQFLDKVKKSNKTLYVYDLVGRQVRWFQYLIESKGIKNYYFMKGGADAFFKIPIKNLMD
ncbi:MAG: rhodanese-like domain-containing protein [Gammaproteobacteria bacterium]|nr:rhodanese-like domain-containing protein [Gammaproteobacteria bacterium]